jgi:hypothetical protein
MHRRLQVSQLPLVGWTRTGVAPHRSVPLRAAYCSTNTLVNIHLTYAQQLRQPHLFGGSIHRHEVVPLDEANEHQPFTAVLAAVAACLPTDSLQHVAVVQGNKKLKAVPLTTDAALTAIIARTQAANPHANVRLHVVPTPDSVLDTIDAATRTAAPEAQGIGTRTHPRPRTEPQQMLSFFTFFDKQQPPPHITAPGGVDGLQRALYELLAAVDAVGTVYLAPEGINGQLAVPLTRLAAFRTAMATVDALSGVELNLGDVIGVDTATFDRLLVKQRQQVLTDGFTVPLDWSDAGRVRFSLFDRNLHSRMLLVRLPARLNSSYRLTL